MHAAAHETEAPLALDLAADAELLREFTAESRAHLDNIEQGVLVLEKCPGDGATLNTIFRAFHTFKGTAAFLNLEPINGLAHVLESLLDLAREHKLAIDGKVIDAILRGRDVLRQFVDEIEARLNGFKPGQTIAIPTAGLKNEVQAIIDSSSPATETSPVCRPATAAAQPNPAMPASVKVETGKLDALLDLVGEMVISQSLVAADFNALVEQKPQFARNLAQLSRITKELRRISMSMRMTPIRGAFHKMARAARDLAARQNKQVQLLTEGEETELDRNVVEQLTDPLLHMIRNSVDHGIETPEKRLAAGKPAIGTILLRACHKGGNICIEINDDGAGLDRGRVLRKAVERGLAQPGAELSDAEIFAFIFSAGFSTAEKLTDISGRGVGLDVVKRNIEELRGGVDIASAPGNGAQFKLTLPLTLAIIDGLVVKVGPEQYIIPAISVRESFRPRPGMITSINGLGEVVQVRGRLIPLLRLSEYFNIAPASADPEEGICIVIQSGARARCLLVDALVAKQEVVIKNLNDSLPQKNCSFAGAAILGDGRVGLILDVNTLAQGDAQAGRLSSDSMTVAGA